MYYKSEYGYTGSVQTFTVPADGWYRVECWGAKGGDDSGEDFWSGGLGGYVSGEVKLSAGQIVYVYVGGKCSDWGPAGWNGGGYGYGRSGSGGGATDIRLTGGAWNDSASLASRILVAAGGGGSGMNSKGGDGGGLSGRSDAKNMIAGGTQTSAGPYGGFGYGGQSIYGSGSHHGGGGGGGWYGGGASLGNEAWLDLGGGGGSSYYGGYGSAEVRNGSTTAGASSNGYARFTLIEKISIS